MADVYDFILTVRKNGQAVPEFNPLIRRVSCDESQPFTYEAASTMVETFVTLPATQLDTIQVLLVTADKAVTLRLDGQTDAGIPLNAGGVVLILNTGIDAGASTNATLDNQSGDTALVKGLAAGT